MILSLASRDRLTWFEDSAQDDSSHLGRLKPECWVPGDRQPRRAPQSSQKKNAPPPVRNKHHKAADSMIIIVLY